MNENEYRSRVWEVATLIKLVAGMNIRSVGIVAMDLQKNYDLDNLEDEITDNDIYDNYCKECEKQ